MQLIKNLVFVYIKQKEVKHKVLNLNKLPVQKHETKKKATF